MNYVTIKYDSYGTVQWTAEYSGPGNDIAHDIAVDNLGNVYVTGTSAGTGDDYVTIKYNSSGVQLWLQRYNGPSGGNDGSLKMKIDAANNVYVTGYSTGAGSTDYATVKYNTNGVQQWVARYNGLGNGGDTAKSIALDADGNIYVTGGSFRGGSENSYITIKYNPAGLVQWTQSYSGPTIGFSTAKSIYVDVSKNVYVGGYSWGGSSGYDYALVKYSQPTGIEKLSGIMPENFELEQNYPNPFNPVTTIRFSSVLKKDLVSLVIYNSMGQNIETLVNSDLEPGKYEVQWNASGYPSGVYYYRIMAGNFSETKKMLLVK